MNVTTAALSRPATPRRETGRETDPGPSSGREEPFSVAPRVEGGPHGASEPPQGAEAAPTGIGGPPTAEGPSEARSWRDAFPARPGAPLVLPGATLAEALGDLLPATPPLPPRLAETLDLLAAGLTNDEIGRRLRISVNGAKHRVQDLYGHLGVHTRSEAAYTAAGLGLLPAVRPGGAR